MPRLSISAARIGIGDRAGSDSRLAHRAGFAALIAAVSVYYLFLLSNGTFQLFAPELFGRAFDSMLVHLLHGQFTVDRQTIGYEAFLKDGQAYSYFGIFCALLRLLALPFTDVSKVDMARLSCLAAAVIFVALQLRALLIVHNTLPTRSRQPELLAVMVVATVLSGPQLYILASAWIYHEPVLWAAAMGAGFNLVVVRAAFGARGLRGRDLLWLAALAGLAINTRPSVGAALCLGTILLVLWAALLWYARGPAGGPALARARRVLSALPAAACDRRVLLPAVVLALFGAVVGAVNFEKWGSPFTFADYHYAIYADFQENALAVLHNYGEFNLARLWSGALYYATGLTWVLKHIPPFTEFLHARYQGIEPPPVVPLLTNPLTVILAGVGLWRLWRNPDLPARSLAILRLTLVGHAAAVLLILTAMYLSLRYHFDLAPFMTLAALVGYRAVAIADTDAPVIWRQRLRSAALGLCVLGIFASHFVLLTYKVWSLGVPLPVRRALIPFLQVLYPLHLGTMT